MLKVKSSSVLDDATAVGAPTTTRSKLGLVALATAGAITLGAPGAYATTIDPLHGSATERVELPARMQGSEGSRRSETLPSSISLSVPDPRLGFCNLKC